MSLELFMGIFGWVAAALLLGLVIGKGMVKVPVRNPKAEVWLPDMDPSNPAVGNPDIMPIDKKRQGDTAPSWTEDTVEKGMADLRKAYRAAGMSAPDSEIRDEVMLMLNAEGGEIE